MSENVNNDIWTVKKMLEWSKGYFEKNKIESPLLDAQILLGDVLNMNKVQLIINGTRPLDKDELARYKVYVLKRVKERLPIAYILGQKDFWSLSLNVSPDVLIPRPDTECIVERILEYIKAQKIGKKNIWSDVDDNQLIYEHVNDREAYYENISETEAIEDRVSQLIEKMDGNDQEFTPDKLKEIMDSSEDSIHTSDNSQTESVPFDRVLSIVDVGTGSGAIILALASELKEIGYQYIAIDISDKALDVAKNNANKLGIQNIQFIKSDLLENINTEADIIVSNPPYITDDEMLNLDPEVKCEPDLALRAGKDGLDVYKRLIPQAYRKLKSDGALFVEIGYQQSKQVEDLFRSSGFRDIRTFLDYGKRPRVVFGRKSSV